MTQQERLASQRPYTMIEVHRGKVSERKLRLFAVACCRCVAHLMTDQRNRDAVVVAERFADWKATRRELASQRPTRRKPGRRPRGGRRPAGGTVRGGGCCLVRRLLPGGGC